MVMQAVSNISSARTANVIDEGSDSNSGSNPFNQQNKRRPEAGNGGRSSIYKGVVPQPNGHWGAQIYANHSRIWLGTFKTEIEAGRAYDSAAIKLRSSDSHRNFPLNEITSQEPEFQEHFETSDILSMIKDGSYHSKFTDYVMSMDSSMGNLGELKLGKGKLNGREYSCHPLFSKELTPSDVGKLNRLVIPKKHAIKYFPQVSETNSGEDENGGGVDDLQLVFYDRDMMRVWKFRYCYWKSSQSFVFTRGWNRFVKEKELKAHDIITFYSCQNAETVKGHQFFCMINVQHDNKDVSNSYVEDAAGFEAPRLAVRKRPLHPDFQGSFESGLGNKRRRVEEDEEQKVVLELGQSSLTEEKKKSVMLFGVQIS